MNDGDNITIIYLILNTFLFITYLSRYVQWHTFGIGNKLQLEKICIMAVVLWMSRNVVSIIVIQKLLSKTSLGIFQNSFSHFWIAWWIINGICTQTFIYLVNERSHACSNDQNLWYATTFYFMLDKLSFFCQNYLLYCQHFSRKSFRFSRIACVQLFNLTWNIVKVMEQ